MTRTKRLIVNADDFGLSTGTNQAIISCHQAGSVSSTTALVNMPAVEQVGELVRCHPRLGVGLHFNLTCGQPVARATAVSSLVGSDRFFLGRGVAEMMAVTGAYKAAHIRLELEAQWQRLLHLGVSPTHIDSHQHLHVFPMVFDVVAGFCREQQIPVRIPRPWRPALGVSFRRRLRRGMLSWMLRRNLNRWQDKILCNAGFASIFDLQLEPAAITWEHYRLILQCLHESPLELMVHPAMVDDEHRLQTRISEVSARDYAILRSPAFSREVAALGYELVNYSTFQDAQA